MSHTLIFRQFSTIQAYAPIWQAMQELTENRTSETPDEVWFLEHEPVFTQGLAGKPEHVLNPHDIPVIQTDRGGQVTYHGPGQLMVYTLLNLNRLGWNTRQLVRSLENVIIHYLASLNIQAYSDENAPGVYVDGAKIASIGLRVKRGLSYHGIAFNVENDLTPFSYINPCGYQGLKMTRLSEFTSISLANVKTSLSTFLTDIIQS